MACRDASAHQKSPCVGEVLKRRKTAKARSARQARSHHFELDDGPADEWCIYLTSLFLILADSHTITISLRASRFGCRNGPSSKSSVAYRTFFSRRYLKQIE